MVHLKRFNIYLSAGLAVAIAFGCQTSPEKHKEKEKQKEMATLRLHLEASPHGSGRTEVASILRDHPVDITVEQTPFATEGNVAEAKVVNMIGGFEISIQLNHEGTWLLEQYTAANHNRKIAVFCQWGKDLSEHRWLAAPKISKRISNGLIVFTPDTSREEADEIVLGLNHVAQKLRSNFIHDE
jgi:hypothetical protein